MALGVVVSVSGGFDVTLAGVRVRSHDWVRSFVAAALGWVMYALAGGRFAWLQTSNEQGRRRACTAAAVVLTLITLVVGLVFHTTAIGGADSYGYASQAELWLEGRTSIDQPWASKVPWPWANATFTPLAYTVSSDPGKPWTIVPSYPPGLPWLMALAKGIGGQEGMFWIVPFLGAMAVLATYGIGFRLASPEAGLIGAFLIAASPIQVFMMMAAMSDVPAGAAWALAIFFMLGHTRRAALAAGAATAVAIAIRPNLVFAAAIIGAWYLVRLWRAQPSARGAAWLDGALFALTAACGVAAVAVVNDTLYGSPLRSGYGTLEGFFSRDYIWPNVRDYFVWLVQVQTPVVLLGFVALALPIRAVWPAARDRAVIVVLGAFVTAVWAFYCYYLHFDAWWYLRFLLPVFPVLLTGIGALVVAIARRAPPLGRVLAVICVLALGAYTLRVIRDVGTFELWKAERHYPTVARLVRKSTERNSVIIAMQHGGSVRYYGGRVSIRYDLLDPKWLDRAVDWLDAQGIRAYLLVDKWEVPEVEGRFKGQKALERLQQPPAALYSGTTTVFLWDLSRHEDGVYPPTTELKDDWSNSRSHEPVELLVPFD